MNLGCARHMFEKYSNTRFREICLVGAELFHADRQTDGESWHFRDLVSAPKIVSRSSWLTYEGYNQVSIPGHYLPAEGAVHNVSVANWNVFRLSRSQACYPLSYMFCERNRIKTARTCKQSSATRRGWRIKALLCYTHIRWWLRYITD